MQSIGSVFKLLFEPQLAPAIDNYKPKSSSWISLVFDEKPKAACQSVVVETGIVSGISVLGRVSGTTKKNTGV